MIKTISAALLAVSVLAAPVLAASADKTTQAPVTKSTQAPVAKTAQAPVIKAEPSKSKLLNANARMGRHHHQHVRHHRHHEHMGMLKTHVAPKVATKHITSAKRG
jgi:hypothetical protein